MRRNIIVAKKALSSEVCEQIIQGAKNNFVKGGIGESKIDKEIRDSETCFLDGIMSHYNLYKPILELATHVNNKFYQFNILQPETLQVTKYDEKNKGFYKPHMDQGHDVAPDVSVRKLSMSIQLTPPEYYEGGQLEFPDDKHNFVEEDAREQGTAIFFPSYLQHGVQPVTKGIRYSLVSWFVGPSFK